MKSSTLSLLLLTPAALCARLDAPLRRRASTEAGAGAAQPGFNKTRALAERDQAVKQSRYFPDLLPASRKRATASAYMVDVDADT